MRPVRARLCTLLEAQRDLSLMDLLILNRVV